jgi:hypothetical protein
MRVFLIIILLIVSGSAVSAQEPPQPTENPDRGFVLTFGHELYFPEQIRFTINLSVPQDTVTAMTLRLVPASGNPIEIALRASDLAETDEPFSRLTYDWVIPRAAPPPLYSDVEYEWIVAATGMEAARVMGEFNFSDPRLSWVQEIEFGAIRLTIPGAPYEPGASPAPYATAIFEQQLQQVVALLQRNTQPLAARNLIVYPHNLPDGCSADADGRPVIFSTQSDATVACDPQTAAAFYQAGGYQFLQATSAGLKGIQDAVVDSLVEQAYAPNWSDLPPWFQRSLQDFYSPAFKSAYSQSVLSAAQTRSLLTFQQMQSADPNNPLWRAQSYAMLLYIASRVGVEGVFDLAAAEGDFATAYADALGEPLDRITESMRRWITTSDGTAAFGLTLYLGATATPRPTQTLTLTPTPSPTATASITPTPTVTGALSSTPRPSSTPTITPTAAPPSVTPRPAGSLNTPTPMPAAPTPSLPPSTTTLIGAIMVTVGVLALIVLLIVALRRRR